MCLQGNLRRKDMKKLGISLIALLLMLSLAACSSDKTDKPATDDKYDIVLITDSGTIDDRSFNQGAWEGVEKYVAEHKDVKSSYLRPSSENDDEYYNTIAKAINEAGAKVVITPGFLFSASVFRAQKDFPDTHFIYVDALPQENMDSEPFVGPNTVSLVYEEQQSGFLAGYAAVKDGMTELGFIGGIPVPAVKKFGIGYLYGAEAAAEEMGVKVNVRWNYANTFNPSTEVTQLASGWYATGTEVIFVSAGGAGGSVFAAANDVEGAKVIGVDSDQSGESEKVITSAIKQLQQSVYENLDAHFTDKFPGGEVKVYGIDKESVGLPTDGIGFDRFTSFDKAQYDAIYADLKADKDGMRSEIPTDHEGDFPTFDLKNVTVIGS